MNDSDEIAAITRYCVDRGILRVFVTTKTDVPWQPVEQKPIETFFADHLLEQWIKDQLKRYPLRHELHGIRARAVEGALQKHADAIGVDALQQRVNECLAALWNQSKFDLWALFSARSGTGNTASPAATSQPRSNSVKIGVLWCTYFDRSGREKRWWRLKEAYRPPSLFGSVMQEAGHQVQLLVCDEELRLSRLDGTKAKIHDDVDVLYLSSHGTFAKGHYEILLNTADWLVKDLGHSNLKAVVFDTCWLIDGTQPWTNGWSRANLGRNLRVILGFDGATLIDRGLALRGKAFAENLTRGDTFADAWIKAVQSNLASPYQRSNVRPVAIGVGDTPADAKSALDTMSLTNMLGPRTTANMAFLHRY